MSKKLIFRQLSVSPSIERSQRFLINNNEDYSSSTRKSGAIGKTTRLAEIAGGTAAECAAVCCCCPCGLADLLFLAIYRVPAGLCRKALRRKRERWLMKRGINIRQERIQKCECGCDESWSPSSSPMSAGESVLSLQLDKDVVELEKEMWDHFYSAGFGRSISQRIISSAPIIEVI